jgi:type II secretory ATPase GspE/PulE/Tfp pilus assembly ATPase PilB-like protein
MAKASAGEAAAPEVFWLFQAVHDAMLAARNVVAKHRTMPGGDAAGSEQSAPQVLERLVKQAERAGASDIHLHMREGAASVAFRLDGVMAPTSDLPAAIAERVFGRIKFLARLKTYQESLPQDGRIDKAALNARNDIRVATYPTVTGEKIVLRLFDTTGIRPLAELELPASARAELERFLRQTAGLLLLTGPAGSGKTTTIYACLRHLAEEGGRHIITVEDPAEQIIPGVMQTEVNEARGLDFAKAARHLLRQDPQVLVIGEIRDEETANIAVRAALTGHLVISTLHAGSCQGVFERLLVLCADHSAVASSLELVLNQRLLRRRCAECSGKGCAACLDTGYRGRLPLVEWLRLNDALRRRIAERDLDGVAAQITLAESARSLVQAGLTTEAEVARVLGFQEGKAGPLVGG